MSVPALLSVCVPTSVLVSIVFWCVLVPGAAMHGYPMSSVLHFTSYNMHAVNTLVLLAEFGLDRMLVPVQHMLLYLLWGVTYTLFEWAIFPSIREWAYPFLRLDTVAAPLWYGGVLAVFLLLFWAVLRLSALKSYVLKSRVELGWLREQTQASYSSQAPADL